MPFGCRVPRDGAFRIGQTVWFVPDTPYIAGTDHSLFKWKARDRCQLTVDLTVGCGKGEGLGFSRWTTTAATWTVRNMCICRNRTRHDYELMLGPAVQSLLRSGPRTVWRDCGSTTP